MYVEIEKKKLLTALSRTQSIVEKKTSMPILVHVLFEVTDRNTLKVFATDLEVSLIDEIELIKSKPGMVAVSAKNLFEIVRELADEPISISKKQNNYLEIKQNKSHFNIVGMAAEEYPVFPSYKSQEFTKFDVSLLLDMIEKTVFCVSTDETRYHLNGVYFERKQDGKNTKFKMVAMDGHRLSLVEKTVEESLPEAGFKAGVIIPRKGLAEITKALQTAQDKTCEFAVEGAQFVFKIDQLVLMVRLIEGRYPNYQQLIPQVTPNSLRIRREDLIASLRRVSLLSNQKYKGVTFQFQGQKLEITSNNPELGDAKEEVEIRYEGKEIKIGFNARYVLDVLNSVNDDEVRIDLNDQMSPGLIRPNNDNNYTCVVMPMRI